MKQLPPSEFTYGKYNMITLPWAVIRTTNNYITWILNQNIIGFCDSGECEIRPRPDEMAVMIEDAENNNYQYWIHIPKDVWKDFLQECKYK